MAKSELDVTGQGNDNIRLNRSLSRVFFLPAERRRPGGGVQLLHSVAGMRGGEERVATCESRPHDRLRRHRDPRQLRNQCFSEAGSVRGRCSRPLLDALRASDERCENANIPSFWSTRYRRLIYDWLSLSLVTMVFNLFYILVHFLHPFHPHSLPRQQVQPATKFLRCVEGHKPDPNTTGQQGSTRTLSDPPGEIHYSTDYISGGVNF